MMSKELLSLLCHMNSTFFFSLIQYPEWHTNFSLKFEMMFHRRLFGGDTSISMENIQIVHHYWNRRKY